MAHTLTCTHIKVTGVRCGSPALRGAQFCYFHQRMHRGVRVPPQTRLHPIANLEDEESIQSALMEVINALMRNTIDMKRATLILRALHIAVKNASRVRYKLYGKDSVKEIPEFAEPSYESLEHAHAMRVGDAPIARVRTAAERRAQGDVPPPISLEESRKRHAQMLAEYFGYPSVEAHAAALAAEEKSKSEKQNVGADPLVRPGGAAAVPQPLPPLPPHNFKNDNPEPSHTLPHPVPKLPHPQPAPSKAEARISQGGDPAPSSRKPPATVKDVKGSTTAPAPKERKNAAHAVRHG